MFRSTLLMKLGSHTIGFCCYAYRAASEPGMMEISPMNDDLRSDAGALLSDINDVLLRPDGPVLQLGTPENPLVRSA